MNIKIILSSLFILFTLISCGTKELVGTKTLTYKVRVISSRSSVHLIMNEEQILSPIENITLPNWMGCEDTYKRGPLSRCTTRNFDSFLNKNLQIPNAAYDNGIEGNAAVRFKLNTEGKIIDTEIVKDPGGGIAIELERMIHLLPPLESAKINKKSPVGSSIEMEVNFDLVLR